MTTWFVKNLGDAMLALEPIADLEKAVSSIYGKTEALGKVAVFTRHESEGRLHCEVLAYFSPEAFVVANAVAAAPCDKPSPNDLNLLVGTADSWRLLFPERNS